MKLKFTPSKNVVLVMSLVLNAMVLFIIITSPFSKNNSIIIPKPPDNYFSSAAIITTQNDTPAIFSPFEIFLKPKEKMYIQYSSIIEGKQNNVFIQPLYDPEIISVKNLPNGSIEIIALKNGETLMQTITMDGVKNIAHFYIFDIKNDNNPLLYKDFYEE